MTTACDSFHATFLESIIDIDVKDMKHTLLVREDDWAFPWIPASRFDKEIIGKPIGYDKVKSDIAGKFLTEIEILVKNCVNSVKEDEREIDDRVERKEVGDNMLKKKDSYVAINMPEGENSEAQQQSDVEGFKNDMHELKNLMIEHKKLLDPEIANPIDVFLKRLVVILGVAMSLSPLWPDARKYNYPSFLFTVFVLTVALGAIGMTPGRTHLIAQASILLLGFIVAIILSIVLKT